MPKCVEQQRRLGFDQPLGEGTDAKVQTAEKNASHGSGHSALTERIKGHV
jgi:hypothetical protein